jgi:hypothetical protein
MNLDPSNNCTNQNSAVVDQIEPRVSRKFDSIGWHVSFSFRGDDTWDVVRQFVKKLIEKKKTQKDHGG